MRMIHSIYSKRLNQFRHLAKYINKLIQTGRFEYFDSDIKTKLLNKLHRLYHALKFFFPKRRLKRILAAAAIFIGLSYSHSIVAQGFSPSTFNPFGLTTCENHKSYSFADIDNDGDQDLLEFASDSSFIYYENFGTRKIPDFGLPIYNPFNLHTDQNVLFIRLADLDADGDIDLLAKDFSSFRYFENTGTPSNPSFKAGIQHPFGLSWAGGQYHLSLADIDADGDLDIFIGSMKYYYKNSEILYFENTGTDKMPKFAKPVSNPFNISPRNSNFIYSEMADIDGDGDFDLIYGHYQHQNIYYMENIGSKTSPSFDWEQKNPFGLQPSYFTIESRPTGVDLDSDGDTDIILSSINYREHKWVYEYFENTIINTDPVTIINVLPNPVVDNLTIQFPAGILNDYSIRLFDISGKLLLKDMVYRNKSDYYKRINIQQLPPGLFILKVNDGENNIVEKIIKQ
jgi:type IX secretion system substrate protein/VCBS repeat protein